jgi:hypothetical protein
MQTYIDGKMRRYNLLFTVNGAAFAIVTFASSAVSEAGGGGIRWAEDLPGDLNLPHLASGAIFFTILMFLDIWAFAWGMRQNFGLGLFTPLGRAILVGICTLIICGWALGAGWVPSLVDQLALAGATLALLAFAGWITGKMLPGPATPVG